MAPRDILTRPAPGPDLTAAYGPLPEQVVDVRLPREDHGRPLVVVVHGGFWRAEYDRTHTGPLAAALTHDGWPVAVVEYRRTGHPGGGWPGTFDDVAAAVRAAPAIVGAAFTARGRRPPPGSILLGHSAGGQLALWQASTAGPDAPGVLALAPVADLGAAYELDLDGGAVAALLGGGPADVPERYAAVDPVRLPPPAAPTIVLHGDLDRQVPPALSRHYAEVAGRHVTLRELLGVEHFGLIDPLSAAWPTVTSALRSLD